MHGRHQLHLGNAVSMNGSSNVFESGGGFKIEYLREDCHQFEAHFCAGAGHLRFRDKTIVPPTPVKFASLGPFEKWIRMVKGVGIDRFESITVCRCERDFLHQVASELNADVIVCKFCVESRCVRCCQW
jgi:hypothetical protein